MKADLVDEWIGTLRLHGRLLALGIKVEPLRLPRSRRIMRAVEREADRDRYVRRALEQARKASQGPTLIRRNVGEIMRIY